MQRQLLQLEQDRSFLNEQVRSLRLENERLKEQVEYDRRKHQELETLLADVTIYINSNN